MDVRCDKCQARYRIDDARVGANGLTMRCGKCGNTFKVTKDSAAPSTSPTQPVAPKAAPASKPAPAPAPDAGATMMFAKAPPTAAPAPKAAPEGAGATMMFVSPLAKAAPKPAPGEDSGSTMVFGSAPVVPPKPAPAMPKAAPKAAPEGAGATMMFAQAPQKPPAPAAPKPPPGGEAAGATMMFAAAPKPAPAPAPKPAPETTDEEAPSHDEEAIPTRASQPAVARAAAPIATTPDVDPIPPPEEDEERTTADPEPQPDAEPQQAKPGEAVGDDGVDQSATTGESNVPMPPPKKKPLPKNVIYGAIAGGAVLVLAIGGVVVKKALSPKPPPEAAVQALESARQLYEKDTIAMYPAALESANAAIAAAPKSTFGEAHALVVNIDVAWAEAVVEAAQLAVDAAQKAGSDTSALDAKLEEAQKTAKEKFKAALEAATAGAKKDPKSAELSLATAGYYRANKSTSNLNKELKRAAALKADDGELALVDGLRLLGEDDGVEKALPKIKAAAAAHPQSARLQYALARALILNKDEAGAKAALSAALKLSPSHERAKLQLALLGGADAPAATPAPEAKPDDKAASKGDKPAAAPEK
ncbi:MAG: zinc-ribbon domain-containing protein [Deltaproteobacteria bacterium]|nr:zinc-ribbon domain-containing protein [Deltaproteobacteria bacterium]